MAGQLQLKQARVLVVGAGGLGCPILQYLAAAGVGTVGIVDDDTVALSNLQRQVLYQVTDIGQPKAAVAAARLSALNPEICLVPIVQRLNTHNILPLMEDYDWIIDGTDNFPTRYLINDACTLLQKPLVFGAIHRFEGQVAVFHYQGGPSYRCLFPQAPPPEEAPNCAQAGVMGVLPGLVGTLMAAECLKMILGIGQVLSGQLLSIDLLSGQQRSFSIRRNEDNFQRQALEADYAAVCGLAPALPDGVQISPTQLQAQLEAGVRLQLVDVREAFEWDICHLAGSIHLPLGQLPSRHPSLDPQLPTVLICHHGIRSMQALQYLRQQGDFRQLLNLTGGIEAWASQIDHSMPRY